MPGTGLGLNIAREIVQAQGGTIPVSSHPEKGATFSMTFPIADRIEAKELRQSSV